MFASFTFIAGAAGRSFASFSLVTRRAGAVLALALPLLAATGPINSHLLIEAGKQFVLGGGQRGAFRVKGTNSGPVAVRVVERFAAGDTLSRGVLPPGGKADLTFTTGSAALIVNLSATRQAELDLRVTGATQALGMTYEGLPAARKPQK